MREASRGTYVTPVRMVNGRIRASILQLETSYQVQEEGYGDLHLRRRRHRHRPNHHCLKSPTWYETGEVLPMTRKVLRFTKNASTHDSKTMPAHTIADEDVATPFPSTGGGGV